MMADPSRYYILIFQYPESKIQEAARGNPSFARWLWNSEIGRDCVPEDFSPPPPEIEGFGYYGGTEPPPPPPVSGFQVKKWKKNDVVGLNRHFERAPPPPPMSAKDREAYAFGKGYTGGQLALIGGNILKKIFGIASNVVGKVYNGAKKLIS